MIHMYEIFISTYPTLLKATVITLQLTLTSLVLGSLIGLLFAFFRISNNKVLNSIAHVYIAI
ncbi:amino acid ABC transporter permease, partial [Klebsiella pneumoniae]|nr:amino acid ABC transporter permease [Klebsiella pneumoniae]